MRLSALKVEDLPHYTYNDYAQQEAGVKYYCIVDPGNESAEVYMLNENKYREKKDFQEEKITFDLGPCSIAFNFAGIFKE